MARPKKKGRHPFPRNYAIAHAFVDALVERPDIDASNPIAKAIVRNVERISKGSRRHG